MDWEDSAPADDDEAVAEAPEDPNAGKRFWFEHATGAGKTVAAVGFVEASRTGGILILTHRRNLVDQFHGELRDRGYGKRIAPALLGHEDTPNGPVTVETYQWFVRNAGNVSDAYAIVICDEAHTALGEKTSAAIRAWTGPVFVGMTATGALIARHVTDLFPTQTSRFDLAQAARRGVISPLRCVRIPPGPGVRTIAKVPLRRGEVDTEFDQEMLAELLDQLPFNLAVADLYKTRFNGVPGVVYSAGVRHAYNVAQAFRDAGMKAQAVSGETPKRELAQILARYERGDIDVLVNAQLLAEGWNSPRATVCMHLAPTASKRIYQQRVGRVTRRHQGKEAGIVVDFVHPATKHDDPVVSLHSLLDRDVYRGGAIVVGPVRRGRGRRLRVERRVLPVTADENRRIEVFERELWRIAVEHLDYGEQVQWAALAGARVAPTGWRRARAMLHFDQGGELKRTFLITAVDRNKNPQLRLRALQEIASGRDAEAFDRALDFVESWPRDDKREGVKVVLQALAEKKIGRRDQANNWIWRCANMTREVHEEYAVQRWPETKRLLGLLVNSSGGAHARNARRLVHAARQQDRRLSAALLAAAIPHTAEAGEVINGARTRMSRKPAALARELLRNFPKGRGKAKRRAPPQGRGRGRRAGGRDGGRRDAIDAAIEAGADEAVEGDAEAAPPRAASPSTPTRRRRPSGARRRRAADAESRPRRRRSRRRSAAARGASPPRPRSRSSRSRPRRRRSRSARARRKPKPAVEVVEVAAATKRRSPARAASPRRRRPRVEVAERRSRAGAPAPKPRAKPQAGREAAARRSASRAPSARDAPASTSPRSRASRAGARPRASRAPSASRRRTQARGQAQARRQDRRRAGRRGGRGRGRQAPKRRAQGQGQARRRRARRGDRARSRGGRRRRRLTMELADQVVVVTGGASGIGRALARRFAAEGARGSWSPTSTAKAPSASRPRSATPRWRSPATSPTRRTPTRSSAPPRARSGRSTSTARTPASRSASTWRRPPSGTSRSASTSAPTSSRPSGCCPAGSSAATATS